MFMSLLSFCFIIFIVLSKLPYGKFPEASSNTHPFPLRKGQSMHSLRNSMLGWQCFRHGSPKCCLFQPLDVAVQPFRKPSNLAWASFEIDGAFRVQILLLHQMWVFLSSSLACTKHLRTKARPKPNPSRMEEDDDDSLALLTCDLVVCHFGWCG